MKTRIPKAYWRSHLPAHVAMQNLAAHFKEEDGATATLLADLADADERKLYLPAGYPSLFAYCVGELSRRPDAVAKRIQAARTARAFPAIFAMVAEGRLCLSGVCLLAPHLTEDNADELLSAAADRSKAEIAQLLAHRKAKPVSTPSEQPTVAAISGNEHAPGHVVVTNTEHAAGHESACDFELTSEQVEPAVLATQFPLHVTLGQEEHDDLRYARALLGHAVPSGDLREILGRAFKALIRELERSKFGVGSRSCAPKGAGKGRHVPAEVRRAVWERDGGRCTFESGSGHRCEATMRLEYDHIHPVARGGRSTVDNLRLRCRPHNQYGAECDFGKGFVAEKRQAARAQAAAEKERKAAAARAAKEAEARRKQAFSARNSDVSNAMRNLGYAAGEVRYVLAQCEARPEATVEECVRLGLKLLAPGRRQSFAPGAGLPA